MERQAVDLARRSACRRCRAPICSRRSDEDRLAHPHNRWLISCSKVAICLTSTACVGWPAESDFSKVAFTLRRPVASGWSVVARTQC